MTSAPTMQELGTRTRIADNPAANKRFVALKD